MARQILQAIFGVSLALALVAFAPGVRADDVNEATELTFYRPVQIPGHRVLQPGTYLFKSVVDLTDSGTGVVRIFSPDGSVIYDTLLTRYIERPAATGATQLSFAESGKKPLILVSWFYPGAVTGQAFVYSSRVETRIAEEKTVTLQAMPDTRMARGARYGANVLP